LQIQPLSETEMLVLEKLKRLGAIEGGNIIVPASGIAEAMGRACEPKRLLSQLVKLGLLKSDKRRGGGYTLTAAGLKSIEFA